MVKWLCGNSLGYYKERLSSFNHCCCLPFFRLLLFVRNLIVWNKLGIFESILPRGKTIFVQWCNISIEKLQGRTDLPKFAKRKLLCISSSKANRALLDIPFHCFKINGRKGRIRKRKNCFIKVLTWEYQEEKISIIKTWLDTKNWCYLILFIYFPFPFFSFFFGKKKKEKLYG